MSLFDRIFGLADEVFEAADAAFEKLDVFAEWPEDWDLPAKGEGVEEEKTVEETLPDGTKVVTKTVTRRWRG